MYARKERRRGRERGREGTYQHDDHVGGGVELGLL